MEKRHICRGDIKQDFDSENHVFSQVYLYFNSINKRTILT